MPIIWNPRHGRVRVYNSRSEDEKQYFDLPNGIHVQILQTDPVWARVQIGRLIGYIKKNLLYNGTLPIKFYKE